VDRAKGATPIEIKIKKVGLEGPKDNITFLLPFS
jgi:hypothetical protein